MKFCHKKTRNTLFLYEVLIRELTKSVIEENKEKQKKIKSILKKYFTKGTILAREMELYKILSETHDLKESIARRLLSEVTRVYHNFNSNVVSKEQEEISSEIKKEFNKEIFMTHIPNYRNLASIYQLFNRKLNPKEKIILEEKIIESLISPKRKEKSNEEIKPITSLAFKLFVKSFNNTYSGELIKEQQELLSRYVLSSADNGVELRIYLNEEIGRLKDILNKSILSENNINIYNDEEMKEKIKQVVLILEGISKEPQIESETIERLLRIQKLSQEIDEGKQTWQ